MRFLHTTGDVEQSNSPADDVLSSGSPKLGEDSNTPDEIDANQSKLISSGSPPIQAGFVKIVRLFVSNLLFCVKLYI